MSTMTTPTSPTSSPVPQSRWAHHAYGSSRVAWCNVCDQSIVSFTLGANKEGLPPKVRKAVDDHLAAHDNEPSP